MDPAPLRYEQLPRDPRLGGPVPFACGTGDASGGPSAAALDRRRVTQCALSRVCGVCGAGLGRPLALLGDQREVERNAFHFPPAHLECAQRLAADWAGCPEPVLGQDAPVVEWAVVTTSGFEFLRPAKGQEDRRPVFCPNSVLTA